MHWQDLHNDNIFERHDVNEYVDEKEDLDLLKSPNRLTSKMIEKNFNDILNLYQKNVNLIRKLQKKIALTSNSPALDK